MSSLISRQGRWSGQTNWCIPGRPERTRIFAGMILQSGFHGLAMEGGKKSGPFVPFARASVHFEQNATMRGSQCLLAGAVGVVR